MKSTSLFLAAAMITATVACAVADFTPPTDDQLDGLLADPGSLKTICESATPAQIADVVVKAIAKTDASNLPQRKKKQVVAVLTAKAVLLGGEQAPAVVAGIVAGVNPLWIPIVVASATVSAGEISDSVLAAVLEQLGADSPAAPGATAAHDNPASVLGNALYGLVAQISAPGAAPVAGAPGRYKGQ